MDFILENQTSVRLGIFAGVLVIMMALEAALPRRKRTMARTRRWSTNLVLVLVNTFAARLLGPLVAGAVAVFAAKHGIGLLNLVELPIVFGILTGMVVLDMAIYWQHVAFHHVPFLWRFHKIHHADRDIDASTGVRFHAVEIVFSMLYKAVCVLVLGPSLIAVILFEVVLNASAMFNHANLKLPIWLDRMIRPVFVTPDMHRVHHSAIIKETNSNYGFCLSIWDRVFGSYISQPHMGHENMVIGLSEYQSEHPGQLVWSLVTPFSGQPQTLKTREVDE